MTKANIGDLVLAETMKMVNRISDYIAKEYQGVRPFDKKEVSPKDRLFEFDHITPADMVSFVEKNGTEAANKYVYEMEQLRQKYGGKK